MITQAVVLCAGLGTRLRPLTDVMPKQMIPVAGKPLLEHLLLHLREQGVKEFFINLHYLPEAIPAYFDTGRRWGVKINYFCEQPEILGTAGGIKSFEARLGEEFFVVYGDMWNKVDLKKFYNFYRAKSDAAGAVVVAKADRFDVDLVELDKDDSFKNFYYRPHPVGRSLENKLLLNAIYILSRKVLSLIPEKKHCELDKEILPQMLVRGWRLYGYPSTEPVLDVGTFQRLEQIKSLLG